MSTYTDASLIFYPSGYKAGKTYSLKPTDGSGDLTFTRASTATRVNESGLIEEVAANVPRLDNSQGGCSTLLLEPQRTNVVLQSENLDSGAWPKNNITSINSDFATSPSGATTADKINYGSGNGFIRTNITLTAASSASIFVKYVDKPFIQIMMSGDVNHYANFDIQNGTIGSVGSASTASIEDYGNGWYRIILNALTGTFNGTPRFYKIDTLAKGWAQGGGVAGSFLMWGGQLELGSYATSYIPTTTTAVTRVVDGLSVSSLFSKGIVGVNGSLFVDINTANLNSLLFTMWNTLNQRSGVIRFTSASNTFFIGNLEGGSGSTQISLGSLPPRAKLLFRKNGTTYTLFYNGVKASTDMTAPAQTWDKMQVESGFSPNMTVNSVILFNSALSDTNAIALTTI